jgi:hypothetical protein
MIADRIIILIVVCPIRSSTRAKDTGSVKLEGDLNGQIKVRQEH